MKKNKGITLVALVVTIVILLILAGITMQLLITDNGILSKAQKTKQAQEIGELRDRISAHILDWSSDKALKEGITIDDLWSKLVGDKIIDNSEEDIKKSSEADNIYEVTTNKGYIVEIIVNDNGSVSIGDIAKGDELPPRINKIEITGKTAKSIEVSITVSRFEGGKLSYYYKKDNEPESSYKKLKENTTDLTVGLIELEQNTIYNIKVVAENKNGKVQKIVNEMTGQLANGTITQKGTTIWSDGTASIELETSVTEVDIQYKVNSNGTWQKYIGAITGLRHGDIIYARIYDGINASDDSTINITDINKPVINSLIKSTVSDNSAKVEIDAIDKESGIEEYEYYISTNANDYILKSSSTSTSYTFSNLNSGTKYFLKVVVKDRANNTSEIISELNSSSYYSWNKYSANSKTTYQENITTQSNCLKDGMLEDATTGTVIVGRSYQYNSESSEYRKFVINNVVGRYDLNSMSLTNFYSIYTNSGYYVGLYPNGENAAACLVQTLQNCYVSITRDYWCYYATNKDATGQPTISNNDCVSYKAHQSNSNTTYSKGTSSYGEVKSESSSDYSGTNNGYYAGYWYDYNGIKTEWK